MALSKPTNGSNADYANRIGLLFDALNNGNYAFPATQVPSADANTLDDYEEGTFTPSVGGSATYTLQIGRYVKVGKRADIWLKLIINAIGTGSTTTISGLPFASPDTTVSQAGTCGYVDSLVTNVVSIVPIVTNNAATMSFLGFTAAASTSSAITVFKNATEVNAVVTYETTS